MQTKTIVISILAIAIIIWGGIWLSQGKNDSSAGTQQITGNVSMVDGKQIITINAKGGYSPKLTMAKAGILTVIKMNTQGTFDCSSALTIPSLGVSKNLSPSGETLIDVPSQNAGTTLQGLCSMGMYNFAISFN